MYGLRNLRRPNSDGATHDAYVGTSISADAPQYDIAVVRYTNNGTGTQSWVRRYDIAGASDERAAAIRADASFVYVIGSQDGIGSTQDGPVVLKLAAATGALSTTWADTGDGVGARVFQKGTSFSFSGVALTPIAPRIRALCKMDGRPWVGEILASDGSLKSAELFDDYGVDPTGIAINPITGDVMVVGGDTFNSPDTQFSTTVILDGPDGP